VHIILRVTTCCMRTVPQAMVPSLAVDCLIVDSLSKKLRQGVEVPVKRIMAAPLTLSHLAMATLAGMMPLLFLPSLPEPLCVGLLLLISLMVVWLPWRFGKLLTVCCLSFCWGTLAANQLLMQVTHFSGSTQWVVASIDTLNWAPVTADRVSLTISRIGDKPIYPAIKVIANWKKQQQAYCAGQRWSLLVRFKPIHSQLNPGGFDVQRWALSQHRVLNAQILRAKVQESGCSIRQHWVDGMLMHTDALPLLGVLAGLAFGDKALLSPEIKNKLRSSGTAHLMAISGLHIGTAALIGWWLTRAMQFLLPVRLIDHRIPLLVSLLSALFYTWLSGGDPPAMRAFIALLLWGWMRLWQYHCHPWQLWLWGVALLLWLDPLLMLSDSFWLSCVAVAGLIFWFQWCPLDRRFQYRWYWAVIRWGHLQLGLTLLFLPMQIAVFHGVSVLAFIANLWAVPVVSLISVPLILVALLLGNIPIDYCVQLSGYGWLLAHASLELVFSGLQWFSVGWLALGQSALWCSLVGWLAVCCWRFSLWKYYPITLTAGGTVLAVWLRTPAQEAWRVDVIDVGHGLSVLVEKQGKAILYDTGDRWQGGSQAQSQILPYLRWQGIDLDILIISHSHRDHDGGTEEIRAAFPQAKVYSAYQGNHPCVQGVNWKWQGLTVEMLWPISLSSYANNNDSCVVRISDGQFSVLLTGDMEQASELRLVKQYQGYLKSSLLQVPHHGSQTSSTVALLRAVAPLMAIVSTARFNPWHLPARKIKQRYKQHHIIWYETGHAGMVSVYFYNDKWLIKGLREHLVPRWYHQRFGVMPDNE
jgi:competence protein ComEC